MFSITDEPPLWPRRLYTIPADGASLHPTIMSDLLITLNLLEDPMTTWPTAQHDTHRTIPFYPDHLNIPKLYETDGQPIDDHIVYLHYHTVPGLVGMDTVSTENLPGVHVAHSILHTRPEETCSHWYIMEAGDDGLAFGWACLNGWEEMAELGYIDLTELEDILEIERDTTWEPIPVKDANMRGWNFNHSSPDPTETEPAQNTPPSYATHESGHQA